jgi:rhodanese-related sulfurtransferase
MSKQQSRLFFGCRLVMMAGCSLVVLWLVAATRPALTWEGVHVRISQTFPLVQTISPLAAQARISSSRPPVVYDVRTSAEYVCSHLPGAMWVEDPTTLGQPHVQSTARDQPIIVYCSVGWRSALVCKRLQEAGYTQVWNLAGGIFSWAHADLPLERGGDSVRVVHPYDAHWGVLLDQALHPSAADE